MLKFGKKEMRILSGETETPPDFWFESDGHEYRAEFVMANNQTNEFVFNIEMKFSDEEGPNKINGIRIEKQRVISNS